MVFQGQISLKVACASYQKLLAKNKFKCFIKGKENYYGNAHMKNFNHMFKTELKQGT